MTKSRKPTVPQMVDIARLAGVSKSTVSRALADSPLVNDKTKALVKKIAIEHNYRLNVAARNFRLKESLTISVLLPTAVGADWRLSDPFFLELLGAIADSVDAHGHQLLLSRTSPQDGNWIKSFVEKRNADGLILIGQGSQHKAINELAKNYKALSVWGAKLEDTMHYPVVGTDNELGGKRITTHLLSQGRRRIAFLGLRDSPEIMQRFAGYCLAHNEFDLPWHKSLVVEDQINPSPLQTQLKKLLGLKSGCDAIVASSDVQAMSAIQSLQELGLSVPRDIAVVGYDDITLAQYYNPALTTIHQDRKQAGNFLVENVLSAINGGETTTRTLDPELVVRDSA